MASFNSSSRGRLSNTILEYGNDILKQLYLRHNQPNAACFSFIDITIWNQALPIQVSN